MTQTLLLYNFLQKRSRVIKDKKNHFTLINYNSFFYIRKDFFCALNKPLRIRKKT